MPPQFLPTALTKRTESMKHRYQLLLPLLVLAAAIAGTARLHAQTDYSYRGALSRLGVGLGASMGFAVPIGDLNDTLLQGAPGRKIDEAAPGIAFRFGLNVSYPFTRTLRGTFATGLDIRNVGKKLREKDGTGTELDARSYNVQYFYLEPGVSVSAFRLALNIGLPMSGSQPVVPTSDDPAATMDIVSDNLEMMLEPRIGATLVLIDKEDGWLGLTIDAGVPLNKIFKETTPSVPGAYVAGDIPATRILNGHLGLTYQFGIPGTGGF